MATSGRLSAAQRAAIKSGAPIVQTWNIMVPTSAAHSAYTSYEIDSGVYQGPGSLNRITRAGSRKHEVWNPSPNVDTTPKAVQYIFQVSNSDNVFFETSDDNVYQIPGGYQAQALECLIKHQLFIRAGYEDLEIEHMAFTGLIIDVRHEDSIDPEGNPKGLTSIITTEQIDAWTGLRRDWTIDDATDHPMTNSNPGGLDFTWTVT